MAKQPKLYVKNDKGRYEEYIPPIQEFDNVLYRKKNGRYVPAEMKLSSYDCLSEGVWVITKTPSCHSIANGKYLYDRFLAMKASDIQEAPSLAELGGWSKLADYLLRNWDKVDGSCVDTMCKSIVGILMQYKNK